MDIMTYIILGLIGTIIFMYIWRQFTASERDTAQKELAGIKAIGKYQSANSKEINKDNSELKEKLDEDFRDTIAGLDANIVPDTLSSGYMSKSVGELSEYELRARLERREVQLKTIMEWKEKVSE